MKLNLKRGDRVLVRTIFTKKVMECEVVCTFPSGVVAVTCPSGNTLHVELDRITPVDAVTLLGRLGR